MPRIYSRICEQCSDAYKGRGQRFCSNHCRVTWTNLHRNVAKRLDVRLKISQARRGRPTTLGRRLPESQRRHISESLKGRKIPLETIKKRVESWKRNVSSNGLSPKQTAHLEYLWREFRGERSPMWKGGTTPLRTKESRTLQYRLFTRRILERDNFACQNCGSPKKLQVHHVKSYAEYPDLRFDVSNCVTLCFPCHNETKRCPRPNRVDEFGKEEDVIVSSI